MFKIDWKLVPDGETLRSFQGTLINANLALAKNKSGMHVTTADAEVVLKYLVRLHETIEHNIYKCSIEQINLCEIALILYESPSRFAQKFDENGSLHTGWWLEAKIDMMRCALYEEGPRAQTETTRFLAAWHQVVSDNYLN